MNRQQRRAQERMQARERSQRLTPEQVAQRMLQWSRGTMEPHRTDAREAIIAALDLDDWDDVEALIAAQGERMVLCKLAVEVSAPLADTKAVDAMLAARETTYQMPDGSTGEGVAVEDVASMLLDIATQATDVSEELQQRARMWVSSAVGRPWPTIATEIRAGGRASMEQQVAAALAMAVDAACGLPATGAVN